MDKEQGTAFINAQAICALAEIEGMKAENMQREMLGHSMAYDESAFSDVIQRYGIHQNAIIIFFEGCE